MAIYNECKMKKLLYISLLFISLFACKTKHKATDRERAKSEVVTSSSVNELQKNDVAITQDTNIGSGTITISNIKEIELVQDESGKPITIIDEKGNKISFPGVSKAKIKTHETTETQQDTTSKKMSVNDKSVVAKNATTQKSEKKQSAKRTSDSKVKTTSTWLWVFLILALVLYLVYRYFKK